MPLVANIISRSPCWEGHATAWGIVRRAVQLAWQEVAGPEQAGRYCEASFVLADNGFVQGLNRTYRDRDRPTNVLSFPNGDSDVPEDGMYELGDVIFAFETVEQEAGQAGIPFGDHLSHLAVHGLLHLLGHDHIDEQDAGVMEGLETEILLKLGFADPYCGNIA